MTIFISGAITLHNSILTSISNLVPPPLPSAKGLHAGARGWHGAGTPPPPISLSQLGSEGPAARAGADGREHPGAASRPPERTPQEQEFSLS